jgi:hypothetical protein
MSTHHAPHTPLWRRVLSPPTTRLGWYSLGFVGAVVLLMFALGMAVGALNAAGLPNLAGYPWLITMVLFLLGAPALATVATGLLAVIRGGERSIVVLASVLFPIIVVLGEVLVPWLLSL